MPCLYAYNDIDVIHNKLCELDIRLVDYASVNYFPSITLCWILENSSLHDLRFEVNYKKKRLVDQMISPQKLHVDDIINHHMNLLNEFWDSNLVLDLDSEQLIVYLKKFMYSSESILQDVKNIYTIAFELTFLYNKWL